LGDLTLSTLLSQASHILQLLQASTQVEGSKMKLLILLSLVALALSQGEQN
jgi:hypothetical protein